MRVVKLNLHESSKLVIKEIIIFWEKARIPVREEYHLIKKLESYHEWGNLQKHETSKLANNRNKEDLFVNKFDDIFDIANADALSLIKIESDKQFLIAQRKTGLYGRNR